MGYLEHFMCCLILAISMKFSKIPFVRFFNTSKGKFIFSHEKYLKVFARSTSWKKPNQVAIEGQLNKNPYYFFCIMKDQKNGHRSIHLGSKDISWVLLLLASNLASASLIVSTGSHSWEKRAAKLIVPVI